MFKKLSLCLTLLLFLAGGASQLTASYCLPEFLEGQGCCPSTYAGKSFVHAADMCTHIECYYAASLSDFPFETFICN
ncbi:MAG: hypothetical protein QNK37_16700 [Acidobacteriota bacterium]|nr:hypothetical protein [Acidobacteriota bacterium]